MRYRKSMGDTYFAMFDEDVRRLKVVRISESSPEPNLVLELSPYRITTSTGGVRVIVSNQSEQMVKRIPLNAEEHLYLWRSPWCMYNKDAKSWIIILDSDRRDKIPGQFVHNAAYTLYNPWQTPYNKLRKSMLLRATAIEHEYQEQQSIQRAIVPMPMPMPMPMRIPAQLLLPSHKPPTHVATIIKRDAIANRMSCMISLEDITEDMKTGLTPCFHIFEADSLSKWVALKSVCPACMVPVRHDDCVLL